MKGLTKNDEPVSETQRRNLTEYKGVYSPRNHEEAYRLICSLELGILNAIFETFDQRAYVDHTVYKILNEKLKQADFLAELKEKGRLRQDVREKVATFAKTVLAPEIYSKLRIRGRTKNKIIQDFRFSCLCCGQRLVIDKAGKGLEIICPNCNKLIIASKKPKFI
jgi:hypothetical protein